MGTVDFLSAEVPCAIPEEFAHLGELLREVLQRLGVPYTHVQAQFEDAGWVSNRWAEILPLAHAEKQQLLELADPVARLTQVAAWSTRQPAAADE